MAPFGNTDRGTRRNGRFQSQDEDGESAADLRATVAGSGVRARVDEGALRLAAVPLSWPPESSDGSDVGVPELQLSPLVRSAAQVASKSGHDMSSPAE